MDTKNQTIDTDNLYKIYLKQFVNHNTDLGLATAEDTMEKAAVKAIVTEQMKADRQYLSVYGKTLLLKTLAKMEVIDMEFSEDPEEK